MANEPLFITVHGVDHCRTDSEPLKDPADLFKERFPGSHVETFHLEALQASSRFYTSESLRDNAKKAITHLHALYGNGVTSTAVTSRPVVFLAHNLGAVLAKQMLLLALGTKHHQWIAYNTVKSYFFETPSPQASENDWESFLSLLVGAHRLPLSSFARLMPSLPLALANIDARFSTIADFFVTQYQNPTETKANLFASNNTPWNFDNDRTTHFNPTILDISGLLRTSSTLTRLLPEYQKFLTYISNSHPFSGMIQPNRIPASSIHWVHSLGSYESWLSHPGSDTLLVTGPPGAGKTEFASQILQLVRDEQKDSSDVFLSFSFHQWDTRRNSERSFLLSIIHQLLTLRQNWFIHIQHIAKMIIELRPISCEQLWSLFRLLRRVCGASRIFLIINAVDHCEGPLSRKIALLVDNKAGSAIKILLTSTGFPQSLPENTMKLALNSLGQWKNSIREMVRARAIQIMAKRPVWREKSDAIIAKLCSGESTFLEVMLHMDLLEHSQIWSTRAALQEHLMVPAFSVDQVFKTMLARTKKNRIEKQALSWVFYSARPLTLLELAVALALGQYNIHTQAADEVTFKDLSETVSWDLRRDLHMLFTSVLKVVDDQVYFVHSTVREYLKGSKILFPRYHQTIAESCIFCIQMVSNCRKIPVNTNTERAEAVVLEFLDYADLYWPQHYQKASSGDAKTFEFLTGLDSRIKRFLSDDPSFPHWLSRYNSQTGWSAGPSLKRDVLSVAAQLGFLRILKGLLEKPHRAPPEGIQAAIDTAARVGDTEALHLLLPHGDTRTLPSAARLATEFGYVDALEKIFTHMPDEGINALGSSIRPPLLLAAPNGHVAIIKSLLGRKGPIGNAKVLNSTGNTIVHCAAQLGDAAMLQVIKAAKPDDFKEMCESKNEAKETPLDLAARSGHPEAFRIILGEVDLDPAGAQRVDSPTVIALKKAAGHGRLALLEDLSTKFPWIAKSQLIQNALVDSAVSAGHYDVVAWLIGESDTAQQRKKMTSEESEKYNTKLKKWLEIAIENGHVNMAKTFLGLIEEDIIKEEQLEWVSMAIKGSKPMEMVRALVEYGISVKSADPAVYNSTLDYCINQNAPDIISYLVQPKTAGLRVQFDEGFKENQLHYAIRMGQDFCLRELLSVAHRTDFLKENSKGRVPLDEAVNIGSIRATKDLLLFSNEQLPGDHTWKRPLTLFEAVKVNNKAAAASIVELLLKNGWRSNLSLNKEYPLHVAASRANAEVVKVLLHNKAEPDALDSEHQTALHLAVASSESMSDIVETAQMLLDAGADPNLQDTKGLTVLHLAVDKGDIAKELVEILLGQVQREGGSRLTSASRKKINVNLRTLLGWTALHRATQHPTITKVLLAQRADIELSIDARLRDSQFTPLMLAVEGRFRDVVKLLLDAGADVNAQDDRGRTSLHINCSHSDTGDESILALLLEKEVSVNRKAADGETPFFKAVSGGRHAAIELLLAKHADPNICGGEGYQSPLQIAILAGDRKAFDALLQESPIKTNVNATGGFYSSALHCAAQIRNVTLVEELLNHGCKPNLKVKPWGAPLHAVVKHFTSLPYGSEIDDEEQWMEIAKLLIDRGAYVNETDDDGRSPLLAALHKNSSSNLIVNLLLEKGAYVNEEDPTGTKPLHRAALVSPSGTVDRLLEQKDIRVDATDRCNRNVLYLAAMSATSDAALKFKNLVAALARLELSAQTDYLGSAILPAVATGNREILNIIFETQEVDMNATDRNGWTALDVANAYGLTEVGNIISSRSGNHGSIKQTGPTEWNRFDRETFVQVSDDGLEAWTEALGPGWEDLSWIPGAVRADFCLPIHMDGCPFFEVEIVEGGASFIAIGLSTEAGTLDLLAGWHQQGSWGYHGDDGSLITKDKTLTSGPSYGTGSVIGVMMDFEKKRLSFFKNGKDAGGFDDVYGQLYPMVSFLRHRDAMCVRANFGKTPFKFPPPSPFPSAPAS